MTVPQFSRPGAVDLSALRRTATGPSTTGGSFVVEVTDEGSLSAEVVNRSTSVVVLLSVWSPDVPESVQINDTLTRLAQEFGGRFVLATLDAKANAALVSAIGIPSVPLVAAALRGQLAPLVQELLPEPEMRALVQQVLEAAAASGITGTAPPAAAEPADTDQDAQPPETPARYPAAEEALMRGDLDDAIAQYEAALASAPGDTEAGAGLARANLLKRAGGVDLRAAREAAVSRPDDVEAQILVADLDLLGGQVDDAFTRLLDVIRRTSDADRDAARKHLIELFAVVGDADPRVTRARRALTAALF
jgi:putative thioredoxin